MRKSTKRRSKIKRKTNKKHSKDTQDEKLCMTKGQLMNVVVAAEVGGYNDAKKKRAPKKCCPKAESFLKEFKAEMRGNK